VKGIGCDIMSSSANIRLPPVDWPLEPILLPRTTTILRVKFSFKSDHGELYDVNSSRDVRVVNNLPHGTLG